MGQFIGSLAALPGPTCATKYIYSIWIAVINEFSLPNLVVCSWEHNIPNALSLFIRLLQCQSKTELPVHFTSAHLRFAFNRGRMQVSLCDDEIVGARAFSFALF